MKYHVITYGCLKNTADTANLNRALKAKGHQGVSDPAEADAIVVHTCSFIEAAKKESIDGILQAGRYKTSDKKLIVTGCLVQQHGDELMNELPEVDAFLGTGQLAQVADVIEQPRPRFIDRANPGGFMDPDVPTERRSETPTATLRLSEGCSHPCTFCVIPRLRGPVQSRTEAQILNEARDLASRGVEEFIVIGQDTGDWGRERKETNRLPHLLRSVADLPEVRWVRLMYMHPASFTEPLLDLFAADPERFPYLDMPLQHIDSAMLTAMQRKTDETGLRKLLDRIHQRAPNLALRTTFIVGFPGETDEHFERLVSFVREGHFDYLGAFAYSQEESTPAAKREDQIPDDLKRERLAALTDAYYDVALKKAERRIGQAEIVLLEESEEGDVLGRSAREAPDIDAVIKLPRRAARAGRFVTARLTGYEAYEFRAEPI